MSAPRFVHLRMHSEYSVTDGIVRIDDAVARARADGMPALALTDAANLFGMVKFYKAARAAGVKPVIGADCWIQNPADREKPSRLLLLCASHAGYLRLCELLLHLLRLLHELLQVRLSARTHASASSPTWDHTDPSRDPGAARPRHARASRRSSPSVDYYQPALTRPCRVVRRRRPP